MKEAAGEANMTVIVIVLLAIVLAVGTPLIRGMMNNVKMQSCCNSAGGVFANGKCSVTSGAYASCMNAK